MPAAWVEESWESKNRSVSMVSITLDTNAFITLESPKEHDRALSQLIRLGLQGILRVYVTEALGPEIDRCPDDRTRTLMRQNLQKFPVLSVHSHEDVERIANDLGSLLFPGTRAVTSGLPQRLADCTHLAIHHLADQDYFITNDLELISKSRQDDVQAKYSLKLLRPSEFVAEVYEAKLRTKPQELIAPRLNIRLFESKDREAVYRLLKSFETYYDGFHEWLKRVLDGTHNYVTKVALWDGEVAGVSITTRKQGSDGKTVKLATFYVSPQHYHQGVGQHLLYHEIRNWVDRKIEKCFVTFSADKSALQTFFGNFGFRVEGVALRRYPGRAQPAEVIMGRHNIFMTVTPNNICTFVQYLAQDILYCDVLAQGDGEYELQSRVPESLLGFPLTSEKLRLTYKCSNSDALVKLTTRDTGKVLREWDLYALETEFSPLVLNLPQRKTMILPIQDRFARALFEYSKPQQELWSPDPTRLLLRVDNVYYRTVSYAGVLKRGTPIVFYVSGQGNQIAVAAALVEEVRVGQPDILYNEYGDIGILSLNEIRAMENDQGMVQAIRFGWLMPFSKTISLKRLRELHPRLNVQGPCPIPYPTFLELCKEGGLSLGG